MCAKNKSPEIDIHCHILPGIDDGPSLLETSLAMATIAADDGINTCIATPHTDGIRVNRETVNAAVKQLNGELNRRNINLNVIPGFEIPYHLINELAFTHTLSSSNFVLIEFPHSFVPGDATASLYQLIVNGLQPVIAHPERNMAILENPNRINDLIDIGVKIQVTAASITGELGPAIEQCAHNLLRKKLIHFVATDSHSPTFRKPVLSTACKKVTKMMGKDLADLIFIHNPALIIQSVESKNSFLHG